MEYDLLYVDESEYSELWKVVKATWPTAKLKDASDYIHDRRFSVAFAPEDAPTSTQWWRWLLQEGVALCSLNFGIAMRTPEQFDEIKLLVAEVSGSERKDD